MGQSYGGYLAVSALAFMADEKWAAAVDESGPTQLQVDPEKGPYRQEFGTDSQLLDGLSPIHKTDQIQTPLMVIHGANDPCVAKSESDNLVAALQNQGKSVDYRVLPDTGHLIENPQTRLETEQSVSDFLIAHLKS